MEITNNIKKSVSTTKVFFSILLSKSYVSVSDIAIFLNVFLGTKTVTGQRINKMLEKAGYQRLKNEKELNDKDFIDIKYIPLKKADFFFKEDLVKNTEEKYRLTWKASVLLDIFNINFEMKDFEIADSIISSVNEYSLINDYQENIDVNILDVNVDYLLEQYKGLNNK